MRELIEKVVYESFTSGLNEVPAYTRDPALIEYTSPMEAMNWKEREDWLTDSRLRDIKRLMKLLSNKELLFWLTQQHCEKFR